MNIIQNIQSIIAVAGLILLILAAIARGVKVIVRSIQDIKGATAEEKQAAKAAIIENLQQLILGWVTDAEHDLGGGTGKLKASKVAALIYPVALTAEIGSVNVADGFPVEEVAKAVGAGVSAAIKTAVEAAQDAPAAVVVQEPADGGNPATAAPQEPPAADSGAPVEGAEN